VIPAAEESDSSVLRFLITSYRTYGQHRSRGIDSHPILIPKKNLNTDLPVGVNRVMVVKRALKLNNFTVGVGMLENTTNWQLPRRVVAQI
jgi:hypothetical protein